jgi:type IV pilus assembly protein PilY1
MTRRHFGPFLAGLALVVFGGWGSPARATLAISDSPLFISAPVEPNILFILDDSGSMQWEILPDGLGPTPRAEFGTPPQAFYLFPAMSGTYGDGIGVYDSRLPWFDDGWVWNLRRRTNHPQNNPLFYDPANTYRPWIRADGTRYPDANPAAALRNPARPGVGSVNLTVQNSWNSWRLSSGNDGTSRSFWPITFYRYTGPAPTGTNDAVLSDPANYVRFQIRNVGGVMRAYRRAPANTGTEVELLTLTWTRPDGSTVTRTVAQEVQNFANWFTYFRSRTLAARGGIAEAFSDLNPGIRVGYGTINTGSSTVDGVSTRTVQSGVRPFSGTGKQDFYDRLLLGNTPQLGTPLRRALDDAGVYFSRNDSRGPWSTTPGELGGQDYACRQSFTILMTDGYWNGDAAPTAAARGNVDGSSWPTITGPGGASFTYAPTNPFADGRSDTLADVAMYYWVRDLRPDIPNLVPTSPRNPAFWQHMVTYGVGLGVFGLINPDTAFTAMTSGSPVINWTDPTPEGSPGKIDDLLHAAVNSRGGFFSAADPDTFANELRNVLRDIVNRTRAATGGASSSARLEEGGDFYIADFNSENWTGELTARDPRNNNLRWQANQRLNAWLAANGVNALPVFTWNNVAGVGGSFLPSAGTWLLSQITVPTGLPTGSCATSAAIVNYIRGDRSCEQPAGPFRRREALIGTIINSEPVFAGPKNEGWTAVPPLTGPSSYLAYLDDRKRPPFRRNAVYVGTNDGMLRAFDAETGNPLFAYVPSAVLGRLHFLVDPNYQHRFYVDGKITVNDAQIGGNWRSVLLAGLGAGGRGVFALDVSQPQSFGPSNVLWERNQVHDPDIGHVFGRIAVTRLPNGTWVAIFGNGYNSASNRPYLFIVRLSDGQILHKLAVGGPTPSGSSNGLSGVTVYREPQQQVARRVYAGDLRGNMWRIDINDSGVPSVAFGGQPLFTDPAGRPVTAAPEIAADPAGGLLVFFGSGKLIEASDRLSTPYPLERFFAVRDRNARITALSQLEQVVLANVGSSGQRSASVSGTREGGWYVNLRVPDNSTGHRGERVLNSPVVVAGRVFFTTYEPAVDPCFGEGSRRTYVLGATNGIGALPGCPNCASTEPVPGTPGTPGVAILPPPPVNPSPDLRPDEGTTPPVPPPPTPGGRSDWCRQIALSVVDPVTGNVTFQPLGEICDGRQIWRQIR